MMTISVRAIAVVVPTVLAVAACTGSSPAGQSAFGEAGAQTAGERFRDRYEARKRDCERNPPKPGDARCNLLKVQVEDPMATPEGRYAHSIVIPGMTPGEYFQHLCKDYAGEFIFKTADNVEGIRQLRLREPASSYKFEHLYAMEDPYGHMQEEAEEPGFQFVGLNHKYRFFERPLPIVRSSDRNKRFFDSSMFADPPIGTTIERYFGHDGTQRSLKLEFDVQSKSRYAFTWRGIVRGVDRELGIAGGELIVLDTQTNEVMGVRRGFAFFRGSWDKNNGQGGDYQRDGFGGADGEIVSYGFALGQSRDMNAYFEEIANGLLSGAVIRSSEFAAHCAAEQQWRFLRRCTRQRPRNIRLIRATRIRGKRMATEKKEKASDATRHDGGRRHASIGQSLSSRELDELRSNRYWAKRSPHKARNSKRVSKVFFAGMLALLFGCAGADEERSPHRWTALVHVEGQPEPVPAEWLTTPEARFAHSIRIPNPVSKDSGYRRGMSSTEYFEHLCTREAGDFIFSKIDQVKGVVQLRAIDRASDSDLGSRFRLEHPEFAITSYMGSPETLLVRTDRYTYFESPPSNWSKKYGVEGKWLRFSGYNQLTDSGMKVSIADSPSSRYGFTWRGLRRNMDRELGIAGGEIIVLDLQTQKVLGVRRAFLRSEGIRRASEGVWWLQAQMCGKFRGEKYMDPRQQHYQFLSSVLVPPSR